MIRPVRVRRLRSGEPKARQRDYTPDHPSFKIGCVALERRLKFSRIYLANASTLLSSNSANLTAS